MTSAPNALTIVFRLGFFPLDLCPLSKEYILDLIMVIPVVVPAMKCD